MSDIDVTPEEIAAYEARRKDVYEHNRAKLAEHNIPQAARRGFHKATGYSNDYIVAIEKNTYEIGNRTRTLWIVTTSFTKDDSSAFLREGWIIGPRGKATRAY
jgi:hypothetical protein